MPVNKWLQEGVSWESDGICSGCCVWLTSIPLPLASLSPLWLLHSPASDWFWNDRWWNKAHSDIWGCGRGETILRGSLALWGEKRFFFFCLDLSCLEKKPGSPATILPSPWGWSQCWEQVAQRLGRIWDLNGIAELLDQQTLRPWPVSFVWQSISLLSSQLQSGFLFPAAKSILIDTVRQYGQFPNISVFWVYLVCRVVSSWNKTDPYSQVYKHIAMLTIN